MSDISKQSAERIGFYAELMNALESSDDPKLAEYLAQYPDDQELQKSAPVARWVWNRLNGKQISRTNRAISLVLVTIIMTCSLTCAFVLTWWIHKGINW